MLFALFALLAAPQAVPVTVAPVAQTAVDAATLAEALRLLDSQGFDEEALRSSELGLEAGMAAMTEQLHKTLGDALPAEFVAQMREVMREHMRTNMLARLPALKRDAAELYAREFTRAELVRLRQLAADPVMVKARERNRILAPRLMMLGINASRAAQPELEAKLKQLVADYLAAKKAKPTS